MLRLFMISIVLFVTLMASAQVDLQSENSAGLLPHERKNLKASIKELLDKFRFGIPSGWFRLEGLL